MENSNNFISSTDNDEECVMHSTFDIIEIMINDEADEVIKKIINDSNIDIENIWNR